MEDAADHGVAAVIMVLSTPEAEAILKKGGLTVVDLFRPFGDVEDLNGVTPLAAACANPHSALRDAPSARLGPCSHGADGR